MRGVRSLSPNKLPPHCREAQRESIMQHVQTDTCRASGICLHAVKDVLGAPLAEEPVRSGAMAPSPSLKGDLLLSPLIVGSAVPVSSPKSHRLCPGLDSLGEPLSIVNSRIQVLLSRNRRYNLVAIALERQDCSRNGVGVREV